VKVSPKAKKANDVKNIDMEEVLTTFDFFE
jgi:ribosomal silencing factor RsfS